MHSVATYLRARYFSAVLRRAMPFDADASQILRLDDVAYFRAIFFSSMRHMMPLRLAIFDADDDAHTRPRRQRRCCCRGTRYAAMLFSLRLPLALPQKI